ncbi:MAG: DegT/DnrJ/EryC1/StrS family aminotransferase [Candidatus Eremiobacteraeota bacterium]|nr:DegT/DnrJ/EryC1/StrS family aminotransferase [Candidatus Eremiobacteraeota bacterium]
MSRSTPVLDPITLVAPQIDEEEVNAVAGVLRSGQLAQGPIVAEFEREFARAIGVEHAVAVNSGTAAIHCGLAAFGIGPGDEVLTTPFTFAATATPILMQRASVRFVDIDPQTFNVDVDAFANAATEKTRAVVGVDLFGLPFDRSGSSALERRGIRLFEDACQAVGASRDGVRAGAAFEAAAFSFYATKNILTGEGGMLTTNDVTIAERARRFRHHGQGERYEYIDLGYNYRLTDVLAAIGRVQLRRLPGFTRARRQNAARYDVLLRDVPGVRLPFVPDGVEHVYHQYSVIIDERQTANGADRDTVRARLSERGVASGIYYPKPLHLHPVFGGAHRAGEFPVAERVSAQILALPIHPALSERQLEHVAASLREAVGDAS